MRKFDVYGMEGFSRLESGIACEHNGCVKALSSMRRDAEVAPKCLLRSLVIIKIKDSLERALEAKKRRRQESRERRKRRRVGRVIMVGCIITEQCP